jgi:RNA polymerase sigma-70 factor (ECF subfamily)
MLTSAEEQSKFEALYFEYRNLMFYITNKILNDRGLAEDAVHQAFIKVLENFDKVGEVYCHKTKSYLVTIVRNTAINMYNSRKRRPTVAIEEIFIAVDIGKANQGEGIDELSVAILELPIIYRDVLKLKYIQGFSSTEIAEMLDISDDAVRKRLERAREKLGEILTKEDLTNVD